MRSRKKSVCTRPQAAMCAVAIFCLTFIGSAFGSQAVERVIYRFDGSTEGYQPAGGLIPDSEGNLYGVNFSGGASGAGTVFELSPPATPGGVWTNSVLHNFQVSNEDGQNPWAGLTFDSKGNLYGTTLYSQSYSAGASVFELSPPATPNGAWTETILHVFPTPYDSSLSTPIFDDQGSLYGTTRSGINGSGVVFELKPPLTPGGAWQEVDILSFAQGSFPSANVIMRKHVLYGSTELGGMFGFGNVFQLVKARGEWTENILYSFHNDGISPETLTFAGGDSLYGTSMEGGTDTRKCGDSRCGAVFELSPPASPGDPWTESTIYNFQDEKDGSAPYGPLVFDQAGNLYGVATQHGLRNKFTYDNGTVFELSPPTVEGGAWTETTLHDFGGATYHDATGPAGPLLFLHGTFYGTANYSNSVFKLVVTP